MLSLTASRYSPLGSIQLLQTPKDNPQILQLPSDSPTQAPCLPAGACIHCSHSSCQRGLQKSLLKG